MTATPESVALVVAAAEAAADKLAEHIVAFDVSEQLAITDAFLLCSAPSDRQVQGIVDGDRGAAPRRARRASRSRREGDREGRWVLLDFIDFVVHVQHTEERVYYSLERLWRDCPTIALPESVTSGSRACARRWCRPRTTPWRRRRGSRLDA